MIIPLSTEKVSALAPTRQLASDFPSNSDIHLSECILLIPAQETSEMSRRQTRICFFKAGWFFVV
jgi:hypothetical protein